MKALQKGLNVVTLTTVHGKVTKVSRNLLVYVGAKYGNTHLAPLTAVPQGNGEVAYVYVQKREPSYAYDDDRGGILAHYKKSLEPCIPMMIVHNKKWKIHTTEYYSNETGEMISFDEAVKLGYKPSNSDWIVPKCTSITKVGK